MEGMTDAPESQKRALRAELRERRRVRTATEREREAASITQHLIDLTSDLQARSIAAYLSLPEEPGTRDFVRWASDNNIRVLLPVSRVDGLLDWAPYDGTGEELDRKSTRLNSSHELKSRMPSSA